MSTPLGRRFLNLHLQQLIQLDALILLRSSAILARIHQGRHIGKLLIIATLLTRALEVLEELLVLNMHDRHLVRLHDAALQLFAVLVQLADLSFQLLHRRLEPVQLFL